jgi:hypothetical protein
LKETIEPMAETIDLRDPDSVEAMRSVTADRNPQQVPATRKSFRLVKTFNIFKLFRQSRSRDADRYARDRCNDVGETRKFVLGVAHQPDRPLSKCGVWGPRILRTMVGVLLRIDNLSRVKAGQTRVSE